MNSLCQESSSHPFPHSSQSVGLTRLVLTSFRSYQDLTLDCETKPVVLTGCNGAGKTNILEALSFLSPGRGLRSAKLSQITNFVSDSSSSAAGALSSLSSFSQQDPFPLSGLSSGSKPLPTYPWSISSIFETPEGHLRIGTGLDSQEGKERRLVNIDGEQGLPQTALSQYISILWLTPQMDRLFVEGTTARRKFLDRLVYLFDRSHAARVARYDYTMRERLKLLKRGCREDAWLSSLEAKMAESSIAIAAARRLLVEKLSQAKIWALGLFPRPRLDIEGLPENLLHSKSALEAEEQLATQLRQNRVQDQESGRTTEGAHKSDLRVYFTEKSMPAELCSTGEQKALLISIIMAAARLQVVQEGLVPLVLFDEVVAHLDETRRAELFDEIIHLRMQAWMTGTDWELFTPLSGQVQHFRVERSTLTRL